MVRKTTSSFVTEIPLVTAQEQLAILAARQEAARQLYNAVLGEAMTRVQLVRNSDLYQMAKAIPKTDKKARSEAFKKARESFRYSDYDLQAYANWVAISSGWIKQHLDANTIQKIATRAFKATERVLFGKAKKVRFKGKGQFGSVEGKTNKQGIRWTGEGVVWKSELHNLYLTAIIDENDPVILHALGSKVKYVRLVRRELTQKIYWFAQLVCEGVPFQKPKNVIEQGLVGIDLGVSTAAIVGDNKAELKLFAEELNPQQKEIRRLQRKMERSRRALNPDNYNPDFTDSRGRKKKGTIKKGRKTWKNSNRYKQTAAKKREMERKQAAHRKSLHGRLVNEVLTWGTQVKMEKVSVKGWQKLFGKSVGYKAPGYFQSELIRKAESAGGSVLLFSTIDTALSQTCLCERREKKSLSQRVHSCPDCGIKMQRDLFSGFLSRYIDPLTKTLSFELARNGWLGLEPALQAAWQSGSNQPARAEARPKPPSNGSELVACDLIGYGKSEPVRANETRDTKSEPPAF